MATHSLTGNHGCSYCEKRFHRADYLKRHLKTHDPNYRALRCPECGRRCYTSLGFKYHVALHAANRGNFTCDVCLKPFPTTGALLEHLRVHVGNFEVRTQPRNYRCEYCEWQFDTRRGVRRHMVVHTKRKDFRCQYCARSYGRQDHLRRHMQKSHPGELERIETGSGDSLEPVAQDSTSGSVKGDSERQGVTGLSRKDSESLVQLPCQVMTCSEAGESPVEGLSICSTSKLSSLTTLPSIDEAFQGQGDIWLGYV